MPTTTSILAALVPLVLATSSTGLATSEAKSALLIEGVLSGKALRIVVDEETAEADVTLDGRRHYLDLDAGKAHRIEADGSAYPTELSAKQPAPEPEIQPWGPGPSIAGHASVYHVMRLDEEICGELLVSTWMKPFVDPAVQVLSMLERIKGDGGIASTGLDGACGKLPFSSYARAGWPLMAGGIDQPIFKTEAISFSYRPSGDELNWRE
ncbi:MAG: hypothetical protein AAGA21_07410 [Pseudomonadota bacterium]